MVSVKGLTTCGGITRVSYTVESGGVGPWGGAPKAMLHGAGQYAFINVGEQLSWFAISAFSFLLFFGVLLGFVFVVYFASVFFVKSFRPCFYLWRGVFFLVLGAGL